MKDKIQKAIVDFTYGVELHQKRGGVLVGKGTADIITAALTLALELVQEDVKELRHCHRCGCEDPSVASNRSMQLSQVSCGDCGYLLQESVPEEDIQELWDTRHTPALDKFREAVE